MIFRFTGNSNGEYAGRTAPWYSIRLAVSTVDYRSGGGDYGTAFRLTFGEEGRMERARAPCVPG